MKKNNHTAAKKQSLFESFAQKVTKITGSTIAFISACTIIVVWLLSGPFFNYSETWQLIINTGTTIITFLMVFLIQKTQNKDSLALQLKLNELVACNKMASNRLIDIEDMNEDEMRTIQKYYTKLAEMSKKEENIKESHSIEEAHQKHAFKKGIEKSRK